MGLKTAVFSHGYHICKGQCISLHISVAKVRDPVVFVRESVITGKAQGFLNFGTRTRKSNPGFYLFVCSLFILGGKCGFFLFLTFLLLLTLCHMHA